MRAINANKANSAGAVHVLEGKIHQSFTVAADELLMRGYVDREQRIALSGVIGDVLGGFGEMAEEILGNTVVDPVDAEQIANKSSTSADYAVVTGTDLTNIDYDASTISDVVEEKGISEVVVVQEIPTTFEELDNARNKYESMNKIRTMVNEFIELAGNIFSRGNGNEVENVRQLAKEFTSRLEDEEDPEEDPEKKEEDDGIPVTMKITKAEDKPETDESKNQFMIWKQDDGSWRWFGIYSNKFRDNDRPAEILSEAAHVEFAEKVEKGELNYPDLYVWHIPTSVGKADLVAYEESGFAIVTGLFTHEGVAKALAKSDADLAMSHGMPVADIRRDEDDPTIIISYVSEEVSVLPRDVAANKMTDFVILKEDESMAIIPDEKRSQVVDLLGEDLTTDLETSLSSRGKSAEDAGIEFKESEAEEVVEETEAAPETVIEAEVEVVEEVVEETVEIEAEVEAETEADTVSKQELTDALAAIVNAVSEGFAGVGGRLDQIEKSVDDIQKEDGEKLAEAVASSPSASLAAKLAEALASKDAGTVIGTKEAHVHGNSKLAKDGPEQAPAEEGSELTGLFFQQWTGR